jgi:hypothetical protein
LSDFSSFADAYEVCYCVRNPSNLSSRYELFLL